MIDKLTYCIPYVILAIILFSLYLKEQKKLKYHHDVTGVRVTAFVLLLFFFGLRGHLFTDFTIYYLFYEKIAPITESNDFINYYEPGFVIYSKILKTFFPNYFCWIFINTFIDLLALTFVFRQYCKSTILPFLFFLAFQGVLIESNLIRNMKALDCFFFSIPYLLDRKIWKYMAWNLLGISFHYSAIIFIPMYFILAREIPKIVVWICLIFANVAYWGNIHFISNLLSALIPNETLMDRVDGYMNMDRGYAFSIGYFERTLTIILFTLLYRNLSKVSDSTKVFYNCSFFFYLFHILCADIIVFAERFSILFIIGNWVNFSNVISCRYRFRNIVNVGITTLVTLKIILSYSQLGAKYQNVLFGVDDYKDRAQEVMRDYNRSIKSVK